MLKAWPVRDEKTPKKQDFTNKVMHDSCTYQNIFL